MPRYPFTPTAILIVGLGSAGRKHYEAVRKLLPVCSIFALSGSRPISEGVTYCAGVEEALSLKPDIAIIATPAPLHAAHALPFVRRGIRTLIEKPIGADTVDVDNLLREARVAGSVVSTGYALRQSTCLLAVRDALRAGAVGKPVFAMLSVGQDLRTWRAGVDASTSVSARADLGGGALLELSHEIDLAQWLVGPIVEVSGNCETLSDVVRDVEDCARLFAKSETGVRLTIHMDMISRPAFRRGLVQGTAGAIRYDLLAAPAVAEISNGGAWKTLATENFALNSLFERQIAALLAEDGEGRLLASGEEGLSVLRVVAAARESSAMLRKVEP